MTPNELADHIEGLGRTSSGYLKIERSGGPLIAAALRLAEAVDEWLVTQAATGETLDEAIARGNRIGGLVVSYRSARATR